MASSQKDMEPQGRGSGSPLHARRPSGSLGLRKTTLESRVHVQTLGLNAEKIFRHRAEGEIFLLTFPFIGPLHPRGCLNPTLPNDRKIRGRQLIGTITGTTVEGTASFGGRLVLQKKNFMQKTTAR